AALNTQPEDASARLAAAVIDESLAKGGSACRPYIATPNLSAAFIEPALAYLAAHDCEIRMGQRLRNFHFEGDHVKTLEFAEREVVLAPEDSVILAVPPWIASELLPELTVPDDFREIANVHFKRMAPKDAAPMTGLIGGTAEWVFA